jgi:hypothetical protein
MIRYVSILLLAGLFLLATSFAWPQETKPPSTEGSQENVGPPAKSGQEEKLDPSVWGTSEQEKKVTLKKLPQLKLKGVIKLKGGEYVALLEIVDEGMYRVRKGDEVTLTMSAEDVRTAEEEKRLTAPMGNQGQPGQAPAQGRQGNGTQGGQVGIVTKPTQDLLPKELQITFKIMELDRRSMAIEVSPRKERIMVRL